MKLSEIQSIVVWSWIIDALLNEKWNKKVLAAVSHPEREVAELRADRELAAEYLKAAMESLDNPDAC